MLANDVKAKDVERAELQDAVAAFLASGNKVDVIAQGKIRDEAVEGVLPDKSKRPRYTEEEEETIRRMCAEGCTITDIARKLGRFRQSVSAKMRQMGMLTANPVGGEFVPQVRVGE